MSDLISRQAAIDVIDAVFPVDPMKSEYAQGIACGAALAKTYVEQLPSAQLSWIPCSERPPRYDDTSEYLVTDKEGRLRHCLLDLYMPETFVTVEERMIVDAVAWRPAPEPWKGGSE